MVKNYFGMLGFDIQNVDELLKDNWDANLSRRYKTLTKAIHPDKIAGWDDIPVHIDKDELSNYANDLMAELNEAYEVLSAPKKRNQYLMEIIDAIGKTNFFEKSKLGRVVKFALRQSNRG